ncbi:hypothetical protein EVAR_76712_1 [Eumeta japonica]|uniref:FP protein C-terminal domain-containing protein n=1 Tax=Eumeta variegata TaxID=151549 RepID=A0A4C1SSY9_EUMVA|nr:hypothetical protein EVAR_76712_1 [Eumeta japonica]
MNRHGSHPRSILVRFSTPRLRDGFLAATISFNKERKRSKDKLNTGHIGFTGGPEGIYIVEHLTATVKELHAAVRKRAKELNYKLVWIRGGKLFMKKDESSERIVIRNHDQ